MTQVNVATLRRMRDTFDGRIIRFEGYREHDEAAAAAGIAA